MPWGGGAVDRLLAVKAKKVGNSRQQPRCGGSPNRLWHKRGGVTRSYGAGLTWTRSTTSIWPIAHWNSIGLIASTAARQCACRLAARSAA